MTIKENIILNMTKILEHKNNLNNLINNSNKIINQTIPNINYFIIDNLIFFQILILVLIIFMVTYNYIIYSKIFYQNIDLEKQIILKNNQINNLLNLIATLQEIDNIEIDSEYDSENDSENDDIFVG